MKTDPPRTVVDHSGAFDATIDSGALDATIDSQLSAPAGRGPSTATKRITPNEGRSTVLPRVEWNGPTPKLVSSSRARFETKRLLGEGGLGTVVAAHDQDIGREVAIKRMRVDVRSPEAVARFVDEVRIVGALEHPNILGVHDVGVDENEALYFVMPCVRGETLEAIVDRLASGDAKTHAHWTFERRVHVFRQLLDAVAFAHERGYIHRDIKPANVMIGPYGEVFLMDWGIAKQVSVPDRDAGTLIGTPAYMSPEQAEGRAVDVRSDVYALSVLLHEFLCLRHYLHDRTTLEALLDGAKNVRAPMAGAVSSPHQPATPMDLSWFVRKGLEKDPARRYQNVREMITRLEARDEGIVPVQCHITFTKRLFGEIMRFMNRHTMLFTLLLVIGVASVVGFVVFRR